MESITIISFYFFLNGKAMAMNRAEYRYFARSEKIPFYVSCVELLKAPRFRKEVRRDLKRNESVRVACRRGGSLRKPGRVIANIMIRR